MYESIGDDLHCPRHGETFSRLGSCAGCVADPGPEIDLDGDDDELPEPPEGCSSTTDHERRLTAQARFLEGLAHKAANAEEPELGLVAKLTAEATRLRRAALDCARERERIERVKQLKRHERAMRDGH